MGAILAKNIADQVPLAERAPVWIVGTVFIFAGLWVLSMGTKSRLQDDDQPTSESDDRDEP